MNQEFSWFYKLSKPDNFTFLFITVHVTIGLFDSQNYLWVEGAFQEQFLRFPIDCDLELNEA